jgi:hypothetical protein
MAKLWQQYEGLDVMFFDDMSDFFLELICEGLDEFAITGRFDQGEIR